MTHTNRAVLCVLLAFYALIVLQNSWLHEDAFITYRTVDNLLNGHGAVWNVGERVPVYTHPLWFFVITLTNGSRYSLLPARTSANSPFSIAICSLVST
jgi:arabinofuranosyltransferase